MELNLVKAKFMIRENNLHKLECFKGWRSEVKNTGHQISWVVSRAAGGADGETCLFITMRDEYDSTIPVEGTSRPHPFSVRAEQAGPRRLTICVVISFFDAAL